MKKNSTRLTNEMEDHLNRIKDYTQEGIKDCCRVGKGRVVDNSICEVR